MKKQIIRWPILVAALLVAILATAVALFDNCAFMVVMNGEAEIALEYGQAYFEEGAYSVFVNLNGDEKKIDETILPEGQVNPAELGSYTLTYRSKYLWRTAVATRTVHVVDTAKPVITLLYNPGSVTLPGQEYVEEGYRAEDNYDGDITEKVVRTVQDNTVVYTVTDSSGNTAQVTRPIQYGDSVAPELNLVGGEKLTVQAGTDYSEPGFSATDNYDGDLTSKVTITGSVDSYHAGTYTVQYSVTDSFGNVTTKTRTVVVEAAKQPDIIKPDGKVIYLTFDDGPGPYTEKLLNVLDNYNVKATFFVANSEYTHLLPKIHQAGHSIGIHTYTHEYSKIYASQAAFFEDLHKIENIIFEETGVKTTLMRFPGGSYSASGDKACKGIMKQLRQAVLDQGYQYFDWNIDTQDAVGAKSAQDVFENFVAGIGSKKSAVVLQHDIKGYSVDAVEMIIQWGMANGYVFLPLTQNSPACRF